MKSLSWNFLIWECHFKHRPRLIYIYVYICLISLDWSHVCVHAQLLSCVQLFVTPRTVAHQAPPSMGLSQQEYWSELPFPPPEESSQPRDRTHVSYSSCIGRWISYHWATLEALWADYFTLNLGYKCFCMRNIIVFLIKSGDPLLNLLQNTKVVVPIVSQIKMIILRNVILKDSIMWSHNFL